MSDYTPLGLEKLARHATKDLTTFRCPRDGVVMRLLACRAEPTAAGDKTCREFRRLPRDSEWRVLEVDLECPACRRRAMGVPVAEPSTAAAKRTQHSEPRQPLGASV
jgi:hypothetical protein